MRIHHPLVLGRDHTHTILYFRNSKKSGKSAALSSIVFGQMHNSGFAKKQPNVLRAQVVSLQFEKKKKEISI